VVSSSYRLLSQIIQYRVVSLTEICLLSENSDDVIKSEISLVHEIALKRNMNVDFKVSKCSQNCFLSIFICAFKLEL